MAQTVKPPSPFLEPGVRGVPCSGLVGLENQRLYPIPIDEVVAYRCRAGTEQRPVHGFESPPKALVRTACRLADVARRIDGNRAERAEAGCRRAGCPEARRALVEISDETADRLARGEPAAGVHAGARHRAVQPAVRQATRPLRLDATATRGRMRSSRGDNSFSVMPLEMA